MRSTPSALALAAVFVGCANTPAVDDSKSAAAPLAVVDGSTTCTTLVAGQNIDAGTVCFGTSGDAFVVTVTVADGWTLAETQMWMGTDLGDMPTNNGGNPQIGLFPYASGALDEAVSYTFTVPFSDLGDVCNSDLYAAVHAALIGEGSNETGWASGEALNSGGGSWAMYLSLTYDCAPPPADPAPESACETAFAYGETTFVDLGLTAARWGWEVGPFSAGDFSTPLYAGAGGNNLEHGTEVGMLNVHYDGSTLQVDYELAPEYTLAETHLYAGADTVTTIAPGQFGNTHEELSGSSDSFTLSELNGEPLYIVAHAVVCGAGLASNDDGDSSDDDATLDEGDASNDNHDASDSGSSACDDEHEADDDASAAD